MYFFHGRDCDYFVIFQHARVDSSLLGDSEFTSVMMQAFPRSDHLDCVAAGAASSQDDFVLYLSKVDCQLFV